MKKMLVSLSVMYLVMLIGCNQIKLNSNEISLFEEILKTNINRNELINYRDVINDYDGFHEYKNIRKCYLYNNKFLFVTNNKGYNKNLIIAVVIDCKSDNVDGIRIIDHNETKHYVRDFENKWFTNRFKDKDVGVCFKRVFLDVKNENEVIAITGATKTTDGVIDAVNLVCRLYKEYLKKSILLDLKNTIENGKIIIKYKFNKIGEITYEDIKKLKSYNRSINVNSTKGTQLCNYEGVRLNDILNLIDDDVEYKRAYVVGADGYYSCLTNGEINKENKVFIMYKESNKTLVGINNKNSSMKLIVIGDEFGQRYTNYIVKIILD